MHQVPLLDDDANVDNNLHQKPPPTIDDNLFSDPPLDVNEDLRQEPPQEVDDNLCQTFFNDTRMKYCQCL